MIASEEDKMSRWRERFDSATCILNREPPRLRAKITYAEKDLATSVETSTIEDVIKQ